MMPTPCFYPRRPSFVWFVLLGLFTLCGSTPTYATEKQAIGLVTHIFDGDTILVRISGRKEKVRLLGIDTPEADGPYTRPEPFHREATELTTQLALGKQVTLVFGGSTMRDKYHRLLAHVILPDGRYLNEILLTKGLAEWYRRFSYSRKKRYRKLEQKAKTACRGIWATRSTCTPTVIE